MQIALTQDQASGCLRRLGYERAGTVPTDPEGTAEGIALREAIDRAAVPAAVSTMVRLGGPQFKQSARQGSIEFGKGAVSIETQEHWQREGDPAAALLVSSAKYRQIRDGGVESAIPEILRSMAFVAQSLGRPRATVAYFNMDSRSEWLSTTIPRKVITDTMFDSESRLKTFYQASREGKLVSIGYPAGHPQCQRCPFRTLCGNAERRKELPQYPPLSVSEAAHAASEYIRLNAIEKEVKGEKKVHYERLKEFINKTNGKVVLDGRFRVTSSDRNDRSVNMAELLKRYPDVYRELVNTKTTNVLRITQRKG